MPWCPKCKTEYREGFDSCNTCGSALVPELEPEPERKPEYDHAEFLITVGGSIDAGIIEGLLKSNEIPSLLKPKDAGAYLSIYTGQTKAGVDIYVPSRLLDRARELVHGFYEEEAAEHPDGTGEGEGDNSEEWNWEEAVETQFNEGIEDSSEAGEDGDQNEVDAEAGQVTEREEESEPLKDSEDLAYKDNTVQEEKAYKKKQRIRSWIAVLLFIGGGGLLLLIVLWLLKFLGI